MDAVRNSCNRPAGTPEWENESITRPVYRKIIIDKLLPAILQKWPENNAGTIHIQQDGAKPHILPNDAAFRRAVSEMGMDVVLYTQPANSPDVNLLDLGFFRAIQSFNDALSRDEFKLITAVQRVYDLYPRHLINRVWLTLQSVFNCIIEDHGDNTFKIPHMKKEHLERIGELPTVIDVTDDAAQYLLEGLEN